MTFHKAAPDTDKTLETRTLPIWKQVTKQIQETSFHCALPIPPSAIHRILLFHVSVFLKHTSVCEGWVTFQQISAQVKQEHAWLTAQEKKCSYNLQSTV